MARKKQVKKKIISIECLTTVSNSELKAYFKEEAADYLSDVDCECETAKVIQVQVNDVTK